MRGCANKLLIGDQIYYFYCHALKRPVAPINRTANKKEMMCPSLLLYMILAPPKTTMQKISIMSPSCSIFPHVQSSTDNILISTRPTPRLGFAKIIATKDGANPILHKTRLSIKDFNP